MNEIKNVGFCGGGLGRGRRIAGVETAAGLLFFFVFPRSGSRKKKERKNRPVFSEAPLLEFDLLPFSPLPDASGAPLPQSPNFRKARRAMSASLSVRGSVREGAKKADACSNASSVAATATTDVTTKESTSTVPSPSSSSDALFPVIDLAPLLLDDASLLSSSNPDALAASKNIAASLVATGCVLVRDPRVSEADNSRFLDLLERYFEQPEDLKRKDARPELHYQIGATPEGVERPSLLREDSTSAARARSLVEKIKEQHKNSSSSSHLPTWPRGADPKWRFFWRVGPRPAATAFPELNAPQVVPRAFEEEWEKTLDE